ncbi:hypothetical protein EA772_01950 [Pedobacter sp. G11]|uniref:WYL domain-containing protein n=1 Tax=Pedobacter sp. G11 TaxID=2482728 RepID=UPI000F603D07|nr:WYL domain-containing protein [Pedobacter sp. G11]AZI24167.1 hypothetical protein EA772_01950 [Pedobacter sp. G11]
MSKFSIGEIVTLSTHPFTTVTNKITISGEYLMIPPLMIVIEIFLPEAAEREITFPGYKCLWFSSKDNLLKDSYFQENELKAIIPLDPPEQPIQLNDLVALSTQLYELGKQRSFLNTETQRSTVMKTNKATALLSFISPVMQVIELRDFDAEKDSKTVKHLRERKVYPKRIAKCKWFNAASEKFSESWIALDALMLIPKISDDIIGKVKKAINKKSYLKLENRLIRPNQISNRSGYYHLDCFDLVSQTNTSIPFTELGGFKIIPSAYKKTAPVFKKKTIRGVSTMKITLTAEKLIRQAVSELPERYLWIRYIDQHDNITTRTVSDYHIYMGEDEAGDGRTDVEFLVGYCHLRDAERHFRLANIFEAKTLRLFS